MKVVVRPRQAGKTTKLIALAARTGATIVVPSRREADEITARAQQAGIAIAAPILWRDLLSNWDVVRGKTARAFIIDNLEVCVQQMTAVPIIAVSLTGEDTRNDDTRDEDTWKPVGTARCKRCSADRYVNQDFTCQSCFNNAKHWDKQ